MNQFNVIFSCCAHIYFLKTPSFPPTKMRLGRFPSHRGSEDMRSWWMDPDLHNKVSRRIRRSWNQWSDMGPLWVAENKWLTGVISIPGTHLSFVFPPKQGLFQSKQGTFGFQVLVTGRGPPCTKMQHSESLRAEGTKRKWSHLCKQHFSGADSSFSCESKGALPMPCFAQALAGLFNGSLATCVSLH